MRKMDTDLRKTAVAGFPACVQGFSFGWAFREKPLAGSNENKKIPGNSL